jgi:hypothetical protein
MCKKVLDYVKDENVSQLVSVVLALIVGFSSREDGAVTAERSLDIKYHFCKYVKQRRLPCR